MRDFTNKLIRELTGELTRKLRGELIREFTGKQQENSQRTYEEMYEGTRG